MAAIKNKRTKRLRILSLFVLIVIGCFIISRSRDHSTVYKGKTIDQWLEETTKADTRNAAIQTFHEAGEFALPDLVRALARRSPFFYRYVQPRLPRPLLRFFPPDKQSYLRLSAMDIIVGIPLSSEQIVTALREAIPQCDDEALYMVAGTLDRVALRDVSGLAESAKAVPDLRHALTRINDKRGSVARSVQMIEGLSQGVAQVKSWVHIGNSSEEARDIMYNHQFASSLMTNASPAGREPETFLYCTQQGPYSPNQINPEIHVAFLLFLTNNTVSSIGVTVVPLPY